MVQGFEFVFDSFAWMWVNFGWLVISRTTGRSQMKRSDIEQGQIVPFRFRPGHGNRRMPLKNFVVVNPNSWNNQSGSLHRIKLLATRMKYLVKLRPGSSLLVMGHFCCLLILFFFHILHFLFISFFLFSD